MGKRPHVRRFLEQLGKLSEGLPDMRAGHHNQQYEMADAVRGAFSVFFTQSESFLAHQRDMQPRHGQNIIVSVFGAQRIPTDNHIRDLLDVIPAEAFAPLYDSLWAELEREGKLSAYHLLGSVYWLASTAFSTSLPTRCTVDNAVTASEMEPDVNFIGL